MLTRPTEHKHLGAARDFYERVKIEELIMNLANRDVGESAEDFVNELLTDEHALLGEIDGGGEEEQAFSQTRLALAVKNMWELQSFVMALDGIETVGTLAQLVGEYVTRFHEPLVNTEVMTLTIRQTQREQRPEPRILWEARPGDTAGQERHEACA